MTTLAERYAEEKSNRIEFDGRTVFGMFTVIVEGEFSVRFVRSVAQPPQGVRISAKRSMKVLNSKSTSFALWHEDADEFRVGLPAGKPQKVQISTVWRSERGSIQTWLGNYGMIVQRQGESVRFLCSNGPGEPTFDDVEFVVGNVLDTELGG